MFEKLATLLDLSLALIILPFILLISLVLCLLSKLSANRSGTKSLLVIQAFHSFDSISRSGHEELITQTDLDGFFDKVYTVYPILGANPFDNDNAFQGCHRECKINDVHTFIEYKMSLFKSNRFQAFGFLLSQFVMLLRLKWLIQHESIAVVRGNCPFLTGLYALVLSKWTNTPYSLRIGGNFDLMYANGLMSYQRIFKRYFVQKIIGKFVFKRAHNVCAVNNNNMQYCIDNGADPKKCKVIRYGNVVDPIHYSEPKERKSQVLDLDFSGRRVALCVGRLTAVKHPEDVLKVTKIASEKIPELLTVFVGDGDMRAELEGMVEQEGLTNHVLFLGNQNQAYLSALYAVSDVYLSPLTGRSMVEAALAALPLIAYDYEWHSEIVISGKTGYLVPYRSIHEMASTLVKLLQNEKLISDLGKEARRFTLKLMDKDKIRSQEIAVFNDLMGSVY